MLEYAAVAATTEQHQSPDRLYYEQQGYGEQFRQLAEMSSQLFPTSTFGKLRSVAETVARDSRKHANERLEALQQWLDESPEAVAGFVADQLAEKAEHGSEWREVLVQAADVVVFPADRIASVATSLLDAAKVFKHMDQFRASEVCWNAIHRAGSLVPTDQIESLLPFRFFPEFSG